MTPPERHPIERFETGSVVTLAAGHAIHDAYAGFLAPLLPIFIANFGLSNTQAGLLTVFAQGPSLTQPLIGHLAGRVNLRLLVVVAPAVTAVMMSLLGVAPTYAIIALLLLIRGLSSAGLHSIGAVMAGNLSGGRLGRGMGYWMVGGALASTMGPLVIVSAVRVLGLQQTPWLMIGGLLTSALLYVRLRDVPVRPPGSAQGLPWRQALQGMRPLLVPLTGLVIVRSFMSAMLFTFLPTLLSEEGADLWIAGAALSVVGAAGIIGALLGGSLSDRLGRRAVLLGSMIITPLLMFIFLEARGWAQMPLLFLLGITSQSIPPVIMALVQESYAQNRAMANGMYLALSFVLRSGAVVVLGMLADLFGLRWAFSASAVIALLGCPIVLFLPLLPSRPPPSPP